MAPSSGVDERMQVCFLQVPVFVILSDSSKFVFGVVYSGLAYNISLQVNIVSKAKFEIICQTYRSSY